ncbi:MAG: response regulator transcription factor [Acidimicrobiia bacterium]|nr:response regulator transcription factor [Acidimicrobiia bacterium]
MNGLALFPVSPSAELASALRSAALEPILLTTEDLDKTDEAANWSLVIIELGDEPLRRLRNARRLQDDTGVPIILAVQKDQIALIMDEGLNLADFIVLPAEPLELRARVRRLAATLTTEEILRYRDLELNTATYQAMIADRPADLTYMEYELLRFFVENPSRVWSREQLLSKVWGYEYYGGARTVDVHVRRLRSKIGEQRAAWITTVRSVGYRFG